MDVDEGGRRPARGPRVLLVDDHDLLRARLRALLEDAGMQVVAEAADGAQAVAAARVHRPEVIVMDLAMPRMDGYEATRLITAELPRTRVVVHTALTEPDAAARATAAGACAVIAKGLHVTALLTAISRAAAPVCVNDLVNDPANDPVSVRGSARPCP